MESEILELSVKKNVNIRKFLFHVSIVRISICRRNYNLKY